MNRRSPKKILVLVVLLFLTAAEILFSQQLPDTSFNFHLARPAYPQKNGPTVFIDEAHNNFHTRSGGFFAFSKLVESDGFRVVSNEMPFSSKNLPEAGSLLVIANALHASNLRNWTLPTPSAFSPNEIVSLKEWVKNGGKLLLIADHMPFAGAASELAIGFGFEYLNGFATTAGDGLSPSLFYLADSTLHPVPGNSIECLQDSIASFTGSAFSIPKNAKRVLSFKKGDYSQQPDKAWQFHAATPQVDLQNYHQGALLVYGKGRMAVFGEAAMFTAQIINGSRKVGFNATSAPHNACFVLEVIHWLDSVEIRK